MNESHKNTFDLGTLVAKDILKAILRNRAFCDYFKNLVNVPMILEFIKKDHLYQPALEYHFENAMVQSKQFLVEELIKVKIRFRGSIASPANSPKDFPNKLKVGTEKVAESNVRIETVYEHNQTDLTLEIKNGIPHQDMIFEEIMTAKNTLSYNPGLEMVDYRLYIQFKRPDCQWSDKKIICHTSRNLQNPNVTLKDYLDACFKDIKPHLTNHTSKKDVTNFIEFVTFIGKPGYIDTDKLCPCDADYLPHFQQELDSKYPQQCTIGM